MRYFPIKIVCISLKRMIHFLSHLSTAFEDDGRGYRLYWGLAFIVPGTDIFGTRYQ